MKRGRDDEKIAGPMFPRLHVNDADKGGGPRAPPRNKMALYEQLSIPSQRFSPPVKQQCIVPDPIPCSSQVARGHQPSKHYSPYSDTSISLQQVEQRHKLDEDDYTVPIFIRQGEGQECKKRNNDLDPGRLSSSNVPSLKHQLKFQKAKQTEHSSQEGINKSTDISKDFVGAKINTVPVSAQKMDLRTESFSESRQSCERHKITAAMDGRNSSNSHKVSLLENQNGLHNDINDTEFCKDGGYWPLQNEISEGGDCISETSILDSVSGHDITTDDVVAIIGQKHFWEARKAIVNQQRLFAVQLFELHRLIKVQKLMATSPNLLLENAAYLGKALKSLPGKGLPLDIKSIKPLPIISKQKVHSDKTSHRKEVSAEYSIAKGSLSSSQNGPLPSIEKHTLSLAQTGPIPSTYRPLNGNSTPKTPFLTSEPNARRPWHLNHQQQGHQWLIPVMSPPSEGLVYKPYPAPGFECHNYGSIHVMGNFPAQPQQYQFPPFPHSYFPYGMPVINATGTTITGSSVDQVNPSDQANLSDVPNQGNTFRDSFNRVVDIEVQTSLASCPVERQRSSKIVDGSIGNSNMLPLFPMSPVSNHSKPIYQFQDKTEQPSCSGVIKVVPHNATSVSASVERIIRSIEEERRQLDSA